MMSNDNTEPVIKMFNLVDNILISLIHNSFLVFAGQRLEANSDSTDLTQLNRGRIMPPCRRQESCMTGVASLSAGSTG